MNTQHCELHQSVHGGKCTEEITYEITELSTFFTFHRVLTDGMDYSLTLWGKIEELNHLHF